MKTPTLLITNYIFLRQCSESTSALTLYLALTQRLCLSVCYKVIFCLHSQFYMHFTCKRVEPQRIKGTFEKLSEFNSTERWYMSKYF